METNSVSFISADRPSSTSRILVVDDEIHARMVFRDFLEDAGFQVLEAENGLEGLEVVRKEKPDAVLTDIRMPVMDGLSFVEAMQKVAPFTPAIIITGTGVMENVISALRLGAWDYVLKPVRDMEILTHTIQKALERAAHLRFEKDYQRQLEKEVKEKTAQLQAEIFDKELAQRNLEYEAYHDSLTHIGNRLLCQKDLQQLISTHGNNQFFGFLLFDINDCKGINDAYGYTFGDHLLLNLGNRMTKFFGNDGNFYRMGGDEFSVFLSGQNREEVIALANVFSELINRPYQIDKETINVTFSFGLTLLAGHTNDPGKLINEAAFAHLQAKKNGNDRIVVYDDHLHQQHLRRLALGKEMTNALNKEEFFLVFQPILDHNSQKLSGFEGLLRWDSSKYGLVSPNEFIPIAEENGFIAELGEWAVENGCRFWAEAGLCRKGLSLSMNVSGKQFFQQGLVQRFKRIMETTGFDPHCFCLEITESALMTNTAETIKKLDQFKELGVRISVDDFGTGYSSLQYLHNFPVNTLKIDMSFVQKMDKDPKAHELIKIMGNMASVFGLELVAEGVETSTQKEMLGRIGCHLHQGFFYSQPLSREDVCDLSQKLK